MKFFIDSADVKEIRAAHAMGCVDGVTTNPSLLAKEGKSFKQTILEICSMVDGPVSAEVVSAHADELAGQRIDRLERFEIEVAGAAGQKRAEMLDQGRLHEAIAAFREMIEQRATQRLEPARLVREHVVDRFGQQPVAHQEALSVRRRDTGPRARCPPRSGR